MKITLVHGQNHKGSTYHIARIVAEKIDGSITEFFLPKDLSQGCLGCYSCVTKGREFCPHSSQIEAIFSSIISSDVIIIGSPTYVMEMTGHLKHLFDHLFSLWLSHRPEEAMFSKLAVVVSTAAGIGMNGVTKSIAKQLFWMGVPKIYRLPVRVAAMSWEDVKNKEQINTKASKIAQSIIKKTGKITAGPKLRIAFLMMRQMHKNNDWTPLDRQHWDSRGWLAKKRPYLDR